MLVSVFLSFSISFTQTDNPSGVSTNALGIYLLVSLIFIMATMFEFAIVIGLQRYMKIKRKISISSGQPIQNILYEDEEIISTKIDTIAMALFISSYALFNIVYWAYYLN